jgi:tRNA-2-methylthio-N6-dimethylallyladenosine synthase
MAKKFFIETFGCQMNELDSEKIAGSLSCEGMEPAADPSQADVIILNTCSVREKAVQKVYARLGEIKKHQFRKRDVLIGVVGCMAQLEGEKILDRAPFVNIIAGPQKGHMMPGLVDRAARTRTPAIDLRMDEDPEPLETTHVLRESPWRAGVTISEGCNRHCSFCIVPFTRGKEKDRPSTSVIREVEDLAGRGYVEVVLLGQTVNSYRDPSPQGMTFAGLLRRLAEIPGLMRLRFTSPHPNDFTDELLDVMISHPKVCDQIHYQYSPVPRESCLQCEEATRVIAISIPFLRFGNLRGRSPSPPISLSAFRARPSRTFTIPFVCSMRYNTTTFSPSSTRRGPTRQPWTCRVRYQKKRRGGG